MKKEITFDSFIRALMTIAILFFAYFLIDKLSNVLIPFIIAWFIAYMLYPTVCFFQYKCRLKYRILSIITTLAIIAGVITMSIKLIIPPVMEEFIRLKAIVTSYVNTQTEPGTIAFEIGQYIKKNINLDKIYDSFSVGDPTKEGYIFAGWELRDFDVDNAMVYNFSTKRFEYVKDGYYNVETKQWNEYINSKIGLFVGKPLNWSKCPVVTNVMAMPRIMSTYCSLFLFICGWL